MAGVGGPEVWRLQGRGDGAGLPTQVSDVRHRQAHPVVQHVLWADLRFAGALLSFAKVAEQGPGSVA